MIVVLPLLSRPRHKTWTSFFFSPSHPASLSNNPMAVAGNHRDHLLFRESELLGKGYVQGSAGTQGGHGAEQPRSWERMVWAGPYTNTVPGAGSAHKHQEGKLITARRPRYQSRLAVYSPVCVTLDSPGRNAAFVLSSPNRTTAVPPNWAKPKGGPGSLTQIVSNPPFRQQNSISLLQHLPHNLLNPALNEALSVDAVPTGFANIHMYK